MDIHKLRENILRCQLIVLVGIFIVLEGFLVYNLIYVMNNQPIRVEENIIESELVRRRIDGVEVAKGKENLYPVAINIDNHYEGWPTFGLSQASVVYETLVEGQFTRFLAVYTPDEDEVEKIGPVRSTRSYFLPLVKEYDGLFAHSGGSPEALVKIEEMEIYNLEEIAWWGPDYFWRVYSRTQPHNLFTSSENLAQAVIDWELADDEVDYRRWQFDEEMIEGKRAEEIKIDFSQGELYDVSYTYSTSTLGYLRFQDDEEYIDELNKKQIEVKNVVIQFVGEEEIIDEVGRIKLDMVGRGKAVMFRDGVMIEGSWRKLDNESRTIFYNSRGDEIKFKPGNIWIEIVPGNRKVEID